MKNRYQDRLPDGTAVYRKSGGAEYDARTAPLIEKYRGLFFKIMNGSVRTESGWKRTEEIAESDRLEMKRLSKALRDEQGLGGRGKSVLTHASWDDTKFDNGKDNAVFVFGEGNSRFSGYVYKEGIPAKSESGTPEAYSKMDGNHLRYFQRKYRIMRKFLGEIIPQSAFVLGEASRKKSFAPGLPETDDVRQTVITIQRRIRWKNLQNMTKEERLDPEFLVRLEKAHRLYVLLRIFIRSVAEESGFPADTIDTKMDLGRLSDVDHIDIRNPSTIKDSLKSPNIMYDGERVYFVDLDQGQWNDQREALFKKLDSPEIFRRWEDAKKSMGVAG